MNLYNYLARLENTLRSRQDITLDILRLMITTIGAVFIAELRFHDGSRLSIVEELAKAGRQGVRRVAYKFHYQRADGTLIFRYDNSPHHPGLSTFPDHKHVGGKVIVAEEPDISDILREIDALLAKN